MKKLTYFLVTILVTLTLTFTVSCGGGGGGGGATGPAAPSSTPTNTSSAPVLSSAADVVSFKFERSENDPALSALSDDLTGNSPDNQNIIVSYNYGTLDTQPPLKPTIQVSPSAQIINDGFVETDATTNTWTLESPADFFNNSVSFTVKAENGNEKEWTVSLEENAPGVYNIHYYKSPTEQIINSPFPATYNESEGINFNNYTSEYNKVCLNNYYFDGWCEENGSLVNSWGDGDKTGDVNLYAKWRPAPYADLTNHKIFANGLPVTVKSNGSVTMVYFTTNNQEKPLSAVNEEYFDFTGFDLYAGTSGDTYAANIDDPAYGTYSDTNTGTLTITGGKLNNVYGGSGNNSNTPLQNGSSISLSGNPVIGNKKKTGIWLSSFTDHTVSVDNTVTATNDGKITLIATSGSSGNDVIVQASGSYTTKNQYTLRNNHTTSTIVLDNSGNNVIVKSGISMTDQDSITWAVDPEDGNSYFTLGEDIFQSGGTILSIGVEDGYFKVPSTTVNNPTGGAVLGLFDMAILYSDDNLNEYLDETGLTTSLKLKYVQFKSETGDMTDIAASTFLSNVHFFIQPGKSNVKIKLNLQTVSLSAIENAGVTYYNGSFYKIVQESVNWSAALAAAQSQSNMFNGLTGYLMTITSPIENMFIYDRVYKKQGISQSDARGWIGAEKQGDVWKWVCGPEAGTAFYEHDSSKADPTINGRFASWDSFKDRMRNNLWSTYDDMPGINTVGTPSPLYTRTNQNSNKNAIKTLENTHPEDKWYWPYEKRGEGKWYVDWNHPFADQCTNTHAYYTGIYVWGHEGGNHGYIIEYSSYNGQGGTPTAPVLVAEQTYSQSSQN